MIPRTRGLALPLAFVATIGCGGETGSAAGPTVTDSAGIAIVTNAGPRWAEGAGWTVADSPSVDLGGGSTPETDLTQVVGAVLLSDGRIAVASALASSVRVFDRSGALVSTIGRAGAGPGEFQTLGGLWGGAGDSLLAADVMLQRLSVIGPAGRFARSFSLGGQSGFVPGNPQIGFALPVGRLGDGGVFGVRMAFTINQPREGTFRDSVTLIRYRPDGSIADTAGRFPGIEMNQIEFTFGGQTNRAPSPVPLGRQTVFGIGVDRFYVAKNDAWEVEVRGPTGALIRLIRLAATPQPLTEAAIAIHRKEQLDQMDQAPQFRSLPQQIKDQFTARINSAAYPATMPFISSLFPVPDGSVWVEEVQPPGEERRRFAVLDRDGAFLGRVTTPARFRVLGVYPNEVVGVWRDPDDVERVRVLAIRR